MDTATFYNDLPLSSAVTMATYHQPPKIDLPFRVKYDPPIVTSLDRRKAVLYCPQNLANPALVMAAQNL